MWATTTKMDSMTDFAVEVDANSAGKEDESSRYTIQFKLQPNANRYDFVVGPYNGVFGLYRMDNKWITLVDLVPSKFIKRGQATNRLKVTCINSEIAIYINGNMLFTFTDRFFGKGAIALGVETNSTSPYSCAFDNFRLYSLRTPNSTSRSEEPLYQDDFANSDSGWPKEDVHQQYSNLYVNGEYVLTEMVKSTLMTVPFKQITQPTNFTVEIETRDLSFPDSGSYSGIIVGWRDMDNLLVYFVCPTDGSFCVARKVAGKWSYPIEWKKSALIITGTGKNALKVSRTDKGITVYVNGSELAKFDDSSFGIAQLGLAVETVNTVPCSYGFDNFKLYSLP
jgi:hypothetical protein